MGTIKRISGTELRNEYFVELRVMGSIHKDQSKTTIDRAFFTLQCTHGLDTNLHGEDVMQLAYERGQDRLLWVYTSEIEDDIQALMQHFSCKSAEEWLQEAAELATEWANGDSYDFAEVDVYRGLLVWGEDLQEIDE